MTGSNIRILCVDDHAIVREGICWLINRQPDMEIVGAAANGAEGTQMFRHLKPDVTLMDLRLGRMNGVSVIEQIRSIDSSARVIVLTTFQGDEDIYRALEAGAVAYLLKDMLSEDLVNTIRQVYVGEHPIINADIEAALSPRSRKNVLTARESEIMELISRGLRNKEISAVLRISQETVQVHVKNILVKFQVRDRMSAVAVALRRGFIHYS